MTTNINAVMASFAESKLDASLLTAVKDMGFQRPTPVQAQAIPAILAGNDVLASAETGSGKTAAYLLPVLQKLIWPSEEAPVGSVLILSPTRELASQIYDQAQAFAESAALSIALVTGGEDFKRQQRQLNKPCALLIATPGRLLEILKQEESQSLLHVKTVVLDEADRMLDMGFRDAVLEIIQKTSPIRQTLMFSATLNHYGVIKTADRILNNPQLIVLNALHQAHKNLDQQMMLADGLAHKFEILVWLLQHDSYDKALVFTTTRQRAIDLQGPLRGKRLRVAMLHGELDHEERQRVMRLYRSGEINILLSTDLAARGLDVQGVQLVVNFDPPRTAIEYVHRIGRAGRADEQGTAITLVASTEWNLVAGIQRYLKQTFARRIVAELQGGYQGPKKLKNSGKAAGTKKEKAEVAKKIPVKKEKIRHRVKKNIGKRRQPSVKPTAE